MTTGTLDRVFLPKFNNNKNLDAQDNRTTIPAGLNALQIEEPWTSTFPPDHIDCSEGSYGVTN